MKNLEIYRRYFDQAYPDYADDQYIAISNLVAALPNTQVVSEILETESAKKIVDLIIPLVKIKNYKSQIPFPENIHDAVKIIIEIKNSQPEENVSKRHVELFENIVNIKGFQLPTISAVLHFCHPTTYPIVDRNIEEGCGLLQKEYPDEIQEDAVPSLPASTTSSNNKLSKYRGFIKFLANLKKLHNEQHETTYGFRELDKALMVYGVSRLRTSAENANNNFHPTQKDARVK